MSTIRLPRIEELLGASLVALTESDVLNLIAGQIPEDADLDFKRDVYGSTDRDKRNLASDVAAFANTSGGIIVIGIDEAHGLAAQAVPQPLSEAEDLRMRQIVAGLVAPVPRFEILRVRSAADPSNGYYVLAVDRSTDAPHAVRVNDGLRYQDGSGR